MKYRPEDIFTPQGILEDVLHNPNLDFLMNIFNIPRAFSVSGFGGSWNVGMHSLCTAFLAFYWAKHCKFSDEKRNKLVTLAVVHDVHEAVTGDILPMFKAASVKEHLNAIQEHILSALNMVEDDELKVDLKIIDLVAFLYEIKQVSPNIMSPKKLQLAHTIADKQREIIMRYTKESNVEKEKVVKFLEMLEL